MLDLKRLIEIFSLQNYSCGCGISFSLSYDIPERTDGSAWAEYFIITSIFSWTFNIRKRHMCWYCRIICIIPELNWYPMISSYSFYLIKMLRKSWVIHFPFRILRFLCNNIMLTNYPHFNIIRLGSLFMISKVSEIILRQGFMMGRRSIPVVMQNTRVLV